MKKEYVLILIGIIVSTTLFSQQSNLSESTNSKYVYPMAIFPKNSPQPIMSTMSDSKILQFELFANELFKNNFPSQVMKDKSVISCSYNKNSKSKTLVNLSLSPETDFDYLKSLLVKNGIKYVSIEDTLMAIENWHPYTDVQLKKINQLNINIINIEFKRNWVLEHEDQRQMALHNGWMNEADSLLEVSKKEKMNYLHEILK